MMYRQYSARDNLNRRGPTNTHRTVRIVQYFTVQYGVALSSPPYSSLRSLPLSTGITRRITFHQTSGKRDLFLSPALECCPPGRQGRSSGPCTHYFANENNADATGDPSWGVKRASGGSPVLHVLPKSEWML